MSDTDVSSYNWCNKEIRKYDQDKLSKNVISLFEKIPNWEWKKLDKRKYKNDQIWESYFLDLEQYEKDYDTTQVNPQTHLKLAKWTWHQRSLKNKQSKILTKHRIKKLDSLKTWSWDFLDSQWLNKFYEVKEFEDKNDHL